MTDLSDAERTALRKARLGAELADEGYPLSDETTRETVLEELTYARYIKVHEGLYPNYGALVTNGGPLPEAPTKGSNDLDGLRHFADGATALIVHDLDSGTATLMQVPLADELAAIELATSSRGTIVQRHESGAITVTDSEKILVNEGFLWRMRPVVRHRIEELQDVLRLAEIGMVPTLGRLLDFAFHQLSPRHIGATLVVDLESDTTGIMEGLSDRGAPIPFAMNLTNDEDAASMSTYLRTVDGACLIARDGSVTRTKTKLKAAETTPRLVGSDRGSRHSSGKWFSYDHPGVVVIVISEDGPVSLYSSGMKVAVFENKPPEPQLSPLMVPQQERSNYRSETQSLTCANCEREIELEVVTVGSAGEPRTVQCPICSQVLTEVNAASVRAYPRKPWFS